MVEYGHNRFFDLQNPFSFFERTQGRKHLVSFGVYSFEFAASQPGLSVLTDTVVFKDFWEFINFFLVSISGSVGVPSEISSWLLPQDVVQTDRPKDLAGELLKLSSFGHL